MKSGFCYETCYMKTNIPSNVEGMREDERGILKAVLLVFTSGLFFCFYSEGFHAKKKKAWENLRKPCLKQPV